MIRSADPAAWREVALDGLDRYLCGQCGARPLSPQEVESFAERHVKRGWRLIAADGLGPVLDVLVDGNYPYSPVRVALPEGPAPLEWPHVESDGALCVLPGQATISARDPVGVARVVVDDAERLIRACKEGRIAGDFRDEFLSYWIIAADDGAPAFIGISRPCGPSREIVVWRGKRRRVFADDRATLDGWLTRGGATGSKAGFTFHSGVMVWLPRPMAPDEYPRTAADVGRLVRTHAPDAQAMIDEAVAIQPGQLDVIIGAPTGHGTCFAALTLRCPDTKTMTRGFRPGRVPRDVAVRRYLASSNRAARSTVSRADHAWVHGRDQDERQSRLKDAHVLVLGCGAVGGGLARLLAQSGVGRLTLIDRQVLDWANISRHVLGASAVGDSKAHRLAEVLRSDFPHLSEIEGQRAEFGLGATGLIDALPTFDLVVSAMADWGADTLLNDLQRSRDGMPSVVYAWLEPHGTAAHALFVPANDRGGCLRCGFNDTGVPLLPVTAWPQGENVHQEPACGALFSPFGAVELAWAHASAAEMAIDALLGRVGGAIRYTWIGRWETVKTAGGEWSPAWLANVGDPHDGGFVVRRDWSRSPTCPLCSRLLAA